MAAEEAPGRAVAFDQQTIDEYRAQGAWDTDTVADLVARNASRQPDGIAFLAPDATLSWREYDELSLRLAGAFVEAGLRPGDLVAVLLTGGALVHVVYLAAQQAGLVTVGLGPRSSDSEIAHLLRLTGATTLLTRPVHRGRPADQLAPGPVNRRIVVDLDGPQLTILVDGALLALPDANLARALTVGRGLGPDDLFFLNSTSGTTGLPKCVRQTMNVRKYFGILAAGAAHFGPDEVFASLIPAPYGFGLWTAHFTPAMYGYPTVLVDEFEVAEALRLVEANRVTVLAAVTSQFIMMLNSPEMARRDLSSLRTMFTGGEKVPMQRAAEFEDRTGCAVLQFYGSNEAGPVSVTRRDDDREHRLGTAGKVVAAQQVRLFDPLGQDVTATGGPGQCAVRGPGVTPGYHGDEEANRQLLRPDGWMLLGDLVTIDPDGYARVTGRVADFIIRGGYNVSALVVEEAVGRHPRVAQVAVVGVADEVLGERVCAFVSTTDGADLDLADLCAHLAAGDVSKQHWPERLVTLDGLPISAGGKVDKARLRAEAATRFSAPRR
jgi:acyl-CoA synthetase